MILSDIHANMEALHAVVEDASGNYDQILCCGDLVGYGADYWQVIRYNVRLEQKNKEKEGKKVGAVELPHHKAAKRTRLHH